MDLVITPYKKEFAAAMAQHINESDEGWPGSGLTQGVPMDGEKVHDWIQSVDFRWYLAWDGEALVGFSTLMVNEKDDTVSYIPLLNAHPRYHGRGVGRYLLRHTVEEAIKGKFRRLDLHTWPANLRAVPLYKKTGFCWKPNTSVWMQNFLPLIMQNPMAQEFFADRDWYTCQTRDLRVEEDKETWENMNVFTYTWKDEEAFLEVIIDQESQGITSIKTETFAAGIRVALHEAPIGVENTIIWEGEGEEEEALVLLARGDTGLPLKYEDSIEKGKAWKREQKVQSELGVELKEKDEKAHTIETQLIRENTLLNFSTGIRLKEVATFQWVPDIVELEPEKRQTVQINVENHLKEPLRGTVSVFAPRGLEVHLQQEQLDIAPEGRSGLSLELLGTQEGSQEISILLNYEFQGKIEQARPQPLPVLVRSQGQVGALMARDTVYLANDALILKIERQGGAMKVFDRFRDAWVLSLGTDLLGPPFYPPAMIRATYEAEFQGDTLMLRAQHPQRSHLWIQKELILRGHEVHSRYRFANRSQKEEQLEYRVDSTAYFMYYDRMALPVDDHILVDQLDLEMFPGNGMPRDEERYHGRWSACFGQGSVVGMVIPPGSGPMRVGEASLMHQTQVFTIPPGSEILAEGPLFYAGPGDWQVLARLADAEQEIPTKALLTPFWPGDMPLALPGQSHTHQLSLYYPSTRPLTAHLTLEGPPLNLTNYEENIELGSSTKPRTSVEIQVPHDQRPGLYAIQARVQAGEHVRDTALPYLIPCQKEGQVHITEKENLWKVDNGLLALEVAPDFAGSAVSLKHNGQEILESPYPEVQTFQWINPWYGGIWPNLVPMGRRHSSGYLFRETFLPQKVTRQGSSGQSWHGVALRVPLQDKEFRGLELSLEYLLLPQSPFLALLFIYKNESSHAFKVKGSWNIFLNPSLHEHPCPVIMGRKEERLTRVLGQSGSFQLQKDWILLQGQEDIALWAGQENGVSLEEFLHPPQLYVSSCRHQGLVIEGGEEKQILTYMGILPAGTEEGLFPALAGKPLF